MANQPTFDKALRILLLIAIAISFYFNIHAVPLFDVDEGAFAEATREMFARGDFISTYLNGVPRYDKPILIYWLQAASAWVFGFNEFALRLPSAVSATLWVGLIYLFVRRTIDQGTATLAAFIAATSLSVSIIAKSATADALLNMLIAATMCAMFLYYRERRPVFLYATFAAMGLGFLAKGPVAVLIPLAVSFIFYGIKGEWRAWFKAAFNPLGIVVFAAIALPWYGVQYLKEGPAFIDGFFFKHNIERFGGPMEGHAGSLVYYVPVVLLGVLPFTALLLKTLTQVRDMFKDDLKLFLLIWFGFVVVFFSLSGTKLPHYVNYGMTGIFILMAVYLGELRSAVWTLLAPLLFFAVLLALPEIVTYVAPGIADPYYRDSLRHINDYISPGYRNFFIIAVILTGYFMMEKKQALQIKLLLTGLVSVFGIAVYLLPAIGNMLQGPVKEAGLLAKREGYALVRWHLNTPSMSVYAERIVADRRPQPGDVVATTPAYLPELGEYKLLYVQNGVVVVRLAGAAAGT